MHYDPKTGRVICTAVSDRMLSAISHVAVPIAYVLAIIPVLIG